jgi:hypothetical protein
MPARARAEQAATWIIDDDLARGDADALNADGQRHERAAGNLL